MTGGKRKVSFSVSFYLVFFLGGGGEGGVGGVFSGSIFPHALFCFTHMGVWGRGPRGKGGGRGRRRSLELSMSPLFFLFFFLFPR